MAKISGLARGERRRLLEEGREAGLRKGSGLKRHVREGMREYGRQAGAQARTAAPHPGRGGRLGEERGEIHQKGPLRDPYQITKRQRKAQRQEFRSQGLGGRSLRSAMDEWKVRSRDKMRKAAARGDATGGRSLVPPELEGLVDPKQYGHQLMGGKEPMPPVATLAGLQGAERLFGYDIPRRKLLASLGEGGIDYRRGTMPTYDQYMDYAARAPQQANLLHEQKKAMPVLSAYATERLQEGGLTPEEEAAIYSRGKSSAENAFSAGMRGEMGRLAASGMGDPRSGIAAQRAMQLQRGRQAGLAEAGRDVTLAELGRKAQIEGLGRGVAGLEEQARLGDVAANLRRRGQYENMLTGAAGLGERAREFDVGTGEARRRQEENRLFDLARLRAQQMQWGTEYGEAMRQAEMQREANRRAGKELEPTDLEYAGGIIGGILGGVGGQ